jgi:hypothetical protein
MKSILIISAASLLGIPFFLNASESASEPGCAFQCCDADGSCVVTCTTKDGQECELTIECRQDQCVVTSCSPVAGAPESSAADAPQAARQAPSCCPSGAPAKKK